MHYMCQFIVNWTGLPFLTLHAHGLQLHSWNFRALGGPLLQSMEDLLGLNGRFGEKLCGDNEHGQTAPYLCPSCWMDDCWEHYKKQCNCEKCIQELRNKKSSLEEQVEAMNEELEASTTTKRCFRPVACLDDDGVTVVVAAGIKIRISSTTTSTTTTTSTDTLLP